MRTRIVQFVLMLVMVSGISGCSLHSAGTSAEGEVTREAPPTIKTVEMSIPRTTLVNALQQELLIDRARIVEVYQSRTQGDFPMYRLFEMHPQSIFGVLGLKNGDVLIAANERKILNRDVFKTYVRLLRNEKTAQVEIMRGPEPMLFKYTFVD